MDFESIMERKQPVRTKVEIVLDDEYADAVGTARFHLNRAQLDLLGAQQAVNDAGELVTEAQQDAVDVARDKVEQYEAELVALRASKDEHVITFEFRALSSREIDALIKAHRPTDAQKTEARKLGLQPPAWNVETYPPALVAAALVSPEMTADQVAELFNSDTWNPAELQSIYQAAEAAIGTRRVVDLGEG